MDRISFNNEVILNYENLSIVIDDYDNIYFIDNGGNESAYEIGDSVSSEDLSPFSELSSELQDEIYRALNL